MWCVSDRRLQHVLHRDDRAYEQQPVAQESESQRVVSQSTVIQHEAGKEITPVRTNIAEPANAMESSALPLSLVLSL